MEDQQEQNQWQDMESRRALDTYSTRTDKWIDVRSEEGCGWFWETLAWNLLSSWIASWRQKATITQIWWKEETTNWRQNLHLEATWQGLQEKQYSSALQGVEKKQSLIEIILFQMKKWATKESSCSQYTVQPSHWKLQSSKTREILECSQSSLTTAWWVGTAAE